MTRDDVTERYDAYLRRRRTARTAKIDAEDADEKLIVDEGDAGVATAWKETLIERLLAMSPPGFERLALRLLREAGFVSATVAAPRPALLPTA